MLNQDGNWRTKTLNTILATFHLALISLGLVSCVIQTPNPPEVNSPQKEQYNNQTNQESDEANDKDDDDNDDNNDNDKD